jgi:tetratricopeptide (TPR) repeat protein
VYLPVRAAQHPAINEGNPATWNSLRDLLERKQYGSSSMFVRRGPLSVQLNKEFWRYFQRQWPLFQTNRLWGAILPLLLGVVGAWWQGRRERVSFLTTMSMFLFSTAGMILFLNFTDHEVRDRDYFFTTAFHWFAIWMGMGTTWLARWVHDSFDAGPTQRFATAGAAVLLLSQPVLLAKNLWFTHDRHANYIAHDYAFNMLAPLKPHGFVYTNGDNDTFPLWYIQQVEGVRKDVRVVNLSLLNTDWYIFQLRDEEPKVPIALDDASIRMLGQGAVQDAQGNIIMTNQYMVQHIMQQDALPGGGWKRPPYFAVTVPEHQGYDKQFSLEGLVYRVNPDTTGPEVDEPATHHNMYELFKYRGLFLPDGSWDPKVYKDENASTLSRNYAAAHLQLAMYYQQRNELPKAIAEMERVERMFPDFVGAFIPLGKMYMDMGDTLKAHELFGRLVKRHPESAEVQFHYGVTSMYIGDRQSALQSFDRSLSLDPEYFYPYVAAYSMLWEAGQHEQALSYLERWLQRHPDDQQVRQVLEANRHDLGAPVPQAAPPPVRPPGMP